MTTLPSATRPVSCLKPTAMRYELICGAEFLRDAPNIGCLIVDYRMPGLDGLEFVSELRKRGTSVPAIMITATGDTSVERRAAELGISQVLHKPLSGRVLMNAISEELD